MASSSETSLLELRVGLFVLVGLAIIGGMVVLFGRVGTGIQESYPLTVEFPNAGGLLVNSKVLLSGATVGVVTDAPQVLDRARGVSLRVKIFAANKIPRNAKFYVSAAGLLGDRFVDIITEPETVGGFYQAGDTVRGATKPGVDEVAAQAGQLVTELRGAVANLNGTLTRINQELLTPQTFQNLQATAANLQATTKNFQSASEKLNGVLDDARGTVGGMRTAVTGAQDTLATAGKAAEDLRKTLDDARKLLATARGAVNEATHGKGVLGTLISDPALSDDLAALVSNLRRSGVLFYRNRPAPSPEPSASLAPRQRLPNSR